MLSFYLKWTLEPLKLTFPKGTSLVTVIRLQDVYAQGQWLAHLRHAILGTNHIGYSKSLL